MSYIKIENLTKVYNNRNTNKNTLILLNINFEIEKGSFTSIIGPSGCGKTTLLRIIAGLENQSSGNIYIENNIIKNSNINFGIVFQGYSLFPWMNVLENVSFGLKMNGYNKKNYVSIANYYLNLVKLSDFKYYYPDELSGGMKQRVAIARALAINPKVILMDEPFSALDENTRSYLQDELLKLWEHHKLTIIFVTHSVDEALYLSDKIIILDSNPGTIKKIIENNIHKNIKKNKIQLI